MSDSSTSETLDALRLSASLSHSKIVIAYFAPPPQGDIPDGVVYGVRSDMQGPEPNRIPVTVACPVGFRPTPEADVIVADATSTRTYFPCFISRARLDACQSLHPLEISPNYPELFERTASSGRVHQDPALTAAVDRAMVDGLKSGTIPPELASDLGMRLHIAAALVLLRILGRAWWDRSILPTERRRESYLRSGTRLPDELDLQTMRLRELGEMIYNLQGVAGIDGIIGRLRTDERGLEGVAAELLAAKVLALSGFRVGFRAPPAYDMEFQFPSGAMAAAEVKARHEFAGITEKGLLNTLSESGRQLPKEGLSVTMLNLPETTRGAPLSDEEMAATDSAVARYLGRRPHVDRVIAFSQRYLPAEDGKYRPAELIKEYRNPKSAIMTPAEILTRWETSARSPHWILLKFLV